MAIITTIVPNVVIFGADGMLGHALMLEAQRRNLRHHLYGRDTDISDEPLVRETLRSTKHPAVIINAAAWTNMDACELHPDKAFSANAWGARAVARVSAHAGYGWPHIHISTGAVFDGVDPGPLDQPGFDEFAHPHPLSTYARTKYAGEELVRQVYPLAVVIRLGHLYGPRGRNGLSTARKKILAAEPLAMNDECKIAPTYVGDAARVIIDVATKRIFSTTLHVSPKGSTTAFQFASRLRDALPGPGTGQAQIFADRLDYPEGRGSLGYKVGRRGEPMGTFAWRSTFQLIRSSLLQHHGIAPIGTWQDGLDRYLAAEASS